jgi:hypothetical protein
MNLDASVQEFWRTPDCPRSTAGRMAGTRVHSYHQEEDMELAARARSARLGALGLVALALAACGGGGGSAGTPPPPNVAVTATNQGSVTRAGVVSMQGGVIGGSLGIAGGGQSSPLAATAPAVQRALAAGVKRIAAGRKTVAVVIGPETVNCTVSGSVTGTIDDRNNDGQLNVGDVLSLTFNSCVEVAGEVMTGRMSATYTQIVASPLTVGAAVAAEDLLFSQTAASTSPTPSRPPRPA